MRREMFDLSENLEFEKAAAPHRTKELEEIRPLDGLALARRSC